MRPAVRITLTAASLAAIFQFPTPGQGRSVPTLTGNTTSAQCQQALHLAESAFRSTNSSLLWPISSAASPSKVVLRPKDRDISGGDALAHDSATFARFRNELNARVDILFWQTVPQAGMRFVVAETGHSWRGDNYATFYIPASISREKLLGSMEGHARAGTIAALLEQRWNPPLFLRDSTRRVTWLIDRGEPYEIFADWAVYVPGAKGLDRPCRITFGRHNTIGLAALPGAVRTFASSLDEALGPGRDEGTLQPTARIRLNVQRQWANVSVRPWAATERPYNTLAEVHAGSAEWSRGSTARTRLLRKIQVQQVAARSALASYYRRQFGINRPTAERMSAFATDYMLRHYFVFHGGASEFGVPIKTPWPEAVR